MDRDAIRQQQIRDNSWAQSVTQGEIGNLESKRQRLVAAKNKIYECADLLTTVKTGISSLPERYDGWVGSNANTIFGKCCYGGDLYKAITNYEGKILVDVINDIDGQLDSIENQKETKVQELLWLKNQYWILQNDF